MHLKPEVWIQSYRAWSQWPSIHYGKDYFLCVSLTCSVHYVLCYTNKLDPLGLRVMVHTAWTSGSMDNHLSHLYSDEPWKEHGDELKYRNWERKQSSYIRWNRWDSPACQKEREGGGVMMGPRREQTACRSLFPLIFIIIRHPGCCSCANIVWMGPTSVCEGSGWAGWVVGGWLYYSISPSAQASLPVTDWKGE